MKSQVGDKIYEVGLQRGGGGSWYLKSWYLKLWELMRSPEGMNVEREGGQR